MSTSPPTPLPPPPPAVPAGVVAEPARRPDELKIVSHSNLFYWWPVWAIGFLMGILSLIDGHRMVVIPKEAETVHANAIEVSKAPSKTETYKDRDVVVMPNDKPLLDEKGEPTNRQLATTNNKAYGVIWAVTLLLVISVTNVPMRGVWSLLVIVTVTLLTIIFWLAGWWEHIFYYLYFLDIRINAGCYFFISGLLFALWLISFLLIDPQQYVIFSPGCHAGMHRVWWCRGRV